MPEGTPVRVRVRVPATSANLGPGYDCLGLALDLLDDVEAVVTDAGCEVQVVGEGAGCLPLDEGHLVVRAFRLGLDHLGAPQPGLRLRAVNRIPHGRGLGSSAAASVAGLLIARLVAGERGAALTDELVLRLATQLEGHPDNVAACLLGGLTIAWGAPEVDPTDPLPDVAAVSVGVSEDLRAAVLVPRARLPTRLARNLLPDAVQHAEAAWNVARTALLVEAVTRRPDLLLPGTEDLLHQRFRAAAMPESMALIERLRAAGLAGVVSGAGPSVLVLHAAGDAAAASLDRLVPADWALHRLAVLSAGAQVRAG